jgi:phage replication-related protein YjqB (UPF0714/DUF867 family)
MTPVPDASTFENFADLARAHRRGRDYEIHVERRASAVAIIAPHGGAIENGTSELARAIAATEFSLYSFEGTRPSKNYPALHLTSHRFDEPECLALIAGCSVVVAIHGCNGEDGRVLLGGLDLTLKDRLAAELTGAGVVVETSGHRFPAVHPRNICNRGARAMGVQLEITQPLRASGASPRLIAAVGLALTVAV